MTVTLAPPTRAPSFAANAWSYSRLVTRGARDRRFSVAAPSPAPNSSTCSPSSEPCRIHGRSCRRVTYRQNDDPQNQVSNRFIDSSEDFEGSQLYREPASLVKQCMDSAERRSELIGIISRWIFELLKEFIDGRTDFSGVRGLSVAAIRDVQRIHRHRGLFCRALVRQRDILCVIGNPLQHSHRNDLIVLHRRKPFRNSLRQRCCRGSRRCDGTAIWIQLTHLIRDRKELTVQLLRVRRIDLLRQQSEHRVPRTVPCRIAGTPPNVAMFLPPTVLRWPQRMVTSDTGKLRIFRPLVLLVEPFAFRAPSQPLHRRAQLHGLSGAPLAYLGPRGILNRVARLRFPRNLPVTRHHR